MPLHGRGMVVARQLSSQRIEFAQLGMAGMIKNDEITQLAFCFFRWMMKCYLRFRI